MSRAKVAFEAAFNKPRDPRSQAYRTGCLAMLTRKLDDGPSALCPHRLGTSDADAWFAGAEEAQVIVRRMAEELAS